MKHLRILTSAVAVLAALLPSCSSPQLPAGGPAPKVTVALPQLGMIQDWDEYPAHVEAVETVQIRARVSGYLESIHFTDGAEVKTGDLLFLIDPRPYQAEVDRVRAQRVRADTKLELTRNDLQRARTLREGRVISDEEFDMRNKAVREAEADVAAARAAESAAQLDLDYTRIKAPISGRIGERLVTVGNLIGGAAAGSAPAMATIVSVDPVYSYFDVDEPAFARYRPEGAAGKPCELAVGGEKDFPHKGRVDFFDNQVRPETGTIRMRAVFDNADRMLVPGMFARVRVPARAPGDAMLVPAVAVSSDQGNKFVLVVKDDGVVESRDVKVGRQHGKMMVVREGLTTRDRVIVSGLLMARPGSKVEVAVDQTADPVASAVPPGS